MKHYVEMVQEPEFKLRVSKVTPSFRTSRKWALVILTM